MSVQQYPDTRNALDLQVWKNNAAFDTGDAGEAIPIKDYWSSMQSISFNGSESVDSCKENQSPGFCISPVCDESPIPIKPLCVNNTTGNLQGQPLKVLFKQGLLPAPDVSEVRNEVVPDDSKIDNEIEEIEMEINRLSSKLKSLRLEKSLRDSTKMEVPAPVQPGKVLEQKQMSKVHAVPRRIEGTPGNSRRRGVTMGPAEIAAGIRSQQRVKQEMTPRRIEGTPGNSTRRGVTMGPAEIAAGAVGIRSQQRVKQEMTPIPSTKSRKGISLGPSEILAGVRSQQKGKQEIAPIPSTQQNRRKSCFLKLKDIDEEKITKERGGGRSLSLSPKSRISKIQASRQGYTTMGSKKPAKKDDRVISSIQPKKLFKEGEKPVSTKKPTKTGRVIASRYNQVAGQNAVNQTETSRRKMSLPGNDRVDIKKYETKRPSSVGKSRVTELQVEIPSETVENKGLGHSQPPSILKIVDLLPKIRTIRCTNETPRDSGAAKKVAELCGKKLYFGTEEDCNVVETSICQTLCFDEEEEED